VAAIAVSTIRGVESAGTAKEVSMSTNGFDYDVIVIG
jgi:hypothetical protein